MPPRLLPVRIPSLSATPHPPAPYLSLEASVARVADFLEQGLALGPNSGDDKNGVGSNGGTVVLTGAGISVDSGIRAYRGKHGSYTVNKKHRPIFYQEFIQEEIKRRRYWARSYLGYPPVRVAEANPTHYAIGALLKLGYVSSIITQNVDGLHHKAHDQDLSTYLSPSSPPASRPPSGGPPPVPEPPIVELHGTLRHAHCLKRHTPVGRDAFQDRLSKLNPAWKKYSDEVQQELRQEKLNPDGDVELPEGVKYEDFEVPPCDECGGPMKPRVIFFGESLEPPIRDLATHLIASNKQLLVVGSSLATFSAFRLVRAMKDQGGRVGLLNVGESRGDPIVDWRVGWDGGAGDVLPKVGEVLLRRSESSGRLQRDPELRDEVARMLRSGVVKRVGGGSAAA